MLHTQCCPNIGVVKSVRKTLSLLWSKPYSILETKVVRRISSARNLVGNTAVAMTSTAVPFKDLVWPCV